MCKRGDVYFVNCGCDTSSSLQCGVRPVLVVSNDVANAHSPVVTVVPLTGQLRKKRSLPTHVLIPCSKMHGLTQPSVALAEQVTSMDKRKLVERRGHIKDHGIMARVTKALQIQIGAVDKVH
jgi:mRNA interferase MazF